MFEVDVLSEAGNGPAKSQCRKVPVGSISKSWSLFLLDRENCVDVIAVGLNCASFSADLDVVFLVIFLVFNFLCVFFGSCFG